MTGPYDEKTELFDPLVMRAQARVGRVVKEKYRLDVLLGVGGMAAVFAATHRNGSRVAIKILHSELSVSSDVRKRFLREGYAANAVGHDGVVRVSDDDVAEDGAAFLVMELLDGETLEDRRVRHGGRLGEDEVLSLADQLLDVLVAAHAKGIVHRDLKPENVFLTRNGRVKVLDFGIAGLRELSASSRATRTGHTMGTPAFMSPEQARGLWDRVDAQSDIWSVGATMFALLSGTEVHSGRTVNEVLIEAATKPAPPLASVLPEASPAVASVVDRSLAFERDSRWQDAATMQEAVRSAYYDRHGSPLSTAPRLAVPPTVVNRTLSSAAAVLPLPGASTTNGGVAASHAGMRRGLGRLVSFAPGLHWRSPIALGVGAIVFAVATGIVALVRSGSEAPAPSAAGATTVVPALPHPSTARATVNLPAPVVAPESSAAPAIAVTDLPAEPARVVETAAAPRPPAARAATATSAARSAAATPAAVKPAKQGCSPPYTVDPKTGAKKWKVECF